MTPRRLTWISAAASVVLTTDTGAGTVNVYAVPPGYTFEVRRVHLELNTVEVLNAAIPLAGIGAVQYLRSGARIEWGNPRCSSINGGSVPGDQNWAEEEGPFLSGGEVFQVRTILILAASLGAIFTATVEGILTQVGSPR